MIGPLLAPQSYSRLDASTGRLGEVSTKDIEWALRAFETRLKLKPQGSASSFPVTADDAIDVLLSLELCIPVQKMPGMYLIPALQLDSIRPDAWVGNSTLDVYRGQRYECARSTDIISPFSFVILQSRCSCMENVRCTSWRDGMKLARISGSEEVECLIEMGIKKGHHCIDVVLRWSSEDKCEAVAKEFLDELKSMIVTVCDERSPGVILDLFYLDTFHLKQLNKDPAIYSSSEVDQKVKDNAFDDLLFSTRPEGDTRCRIRDLWIFVPHSGSCMHFI